MMARGGINHLALTVSDLERSAKFYDEVLGLAGYARQEVPETTQIAMKTRLLAWASPNGSVTMRPAKSESVHKKHDRNAPGLNHIAFAVECRTDVDEAHERLVEMGAPILDAPAEYSYFPGYYAVYFTDPDGLKLEFVYWPES
jgi:glyoxylase I family protein